MYFLMIRPQKKREREINTMRNSVKAGDEVITIGGIRGKIVKAREKEDVLTIQVGADKVKFDVMRWAISKVETAAPAQEKKRRAIVDEEPEALEETVDSDETASEAAGNEAPKALPRRLKRKNPEQEAGIEE
jgi:preprotein translocase YajC subunit